MKKIRIEWLFLLPILIYMGVFIVFPYANIVKNSFTKNWTGEWTLSNYRNLATKPQYFRALLNSLTFVSISTLIAAFFGSLIGFSSMKLSERTKNTLSSLFSLPMTLSGLVVAFAFIVLLGRTGVINILMRDVLKLKFWHFNVYSWSGLVIVYAFFNIPLFSITMIGAFRNLDKSLIEAARNLGASTPEVWRYVIIPVLSPAFLAATSIVFASMMGAFGTALALTGMSKLLLSLLIYSHASESNFNIPQADALAILLGLTTAFSLLLFNTIERRMRVK